MIAGPEQALADRAHKRFEGREADLVVRALDMVVKAHDGRRRLDGSPYLHHVIEVAHILDTWKAPAHIIAAGLLHDVFKPTYSSLNSSTSRLHELDSTVAELVEQVSMLSQFGDTLHMPKDVPASEDQFSGTDNLAKQMPWVARIVQRHPMAMVIKIADRLSNLRSIEVLTPEKQATIAITAMNMYVPFAERLGLRIAARDLEDQAFQMLRPVEYQEAARLLADQDHQAILNTACKELDRYLAESGSTGSVTIAPVSVYSVHRSKLAFVKHPRMTPHRLLLILTNSLTDCYQALGLLHNFWTPVPGEFKDHIADPKPNGYRSLRTRVRYQPGAAPLVVIRTCAMNLVAEYGIIAEWHGVERHLLPELPQWREPEPGKITVFTPDGDQKILPVGATPIDFAYAIHTTLGNQCTAAVVNGQHVSLDVPLKTGDVIKMLSSSANVNPSIQWLSYAKTVKARNAIRRYLNLRKPEEATRVGREILQAALHERGVVLSNDDLTTLLNTIAQQRGSSSVRELLEAIALGRRPTTTVVSQILTALGSAQNSHALRARIESLANSHLPQQLARCCHPLPPDLIVGHVNRSNYVIIHRANCHNVRQLTTPIAAKWETVRWQHGLELHIVVTPDRGGLVAQIATLARDAGICLTSFHADQMEDGSARIQMGLGNATRTEIERVQRSLMEKVQGLRNVVLRSPALPSRLYANSVLADQFINPHTLKPVTGNDFYGRQTDLHDLVDNLRGMRPGQAVLLWGPRRIGKSSLLLEFKRSVLHGPYYLPVYIDMQSLSGARISAFLHNVTTAITTEGNYIDITAPSLKKLKQDPLGHFRGFMEELRRRDDRQIVLMIDEFQLLGTLQDEGTAGVPDIFRYFRSLVQHSGGISFVFSGGGVRDILRRHVGAASLIDVTVEQKIGCLDSDAAYQLIVHPAKRIKYAREVIEQLKDLTACHPYFLQWVCMELVRRADAENRSSIDDTHLSALLTTWLPDQQEEHMSHVWGVDSGIEDARILRNKVALFAIAASTFAGESVTLDRLLATNVTAVLGDNSLWEALDDLVSMGTIQTDDNVTYHPQVDLCVRWLRENYSFEKASRDLGALSL